MSTTRKSDSGAPMEAGPNASYAPENRDTDLFEPDPESRLRRPPSPRQSKSTGEINANGSFLWVHSLDLGNKRLQHQISDNSSLAKDSRTLFNPGTYYT